MKTCYICDTALNDKNKSKEHIILNAIGGKLKSSELLCNLCNSKLGHEADSELAKQLLFIASYLQIKRDSGNFPILKGLKTKDGAEYHLLDGSKPILSKPTVTIEESNNTVSFSISARNENEFLSILKGIKKKYPSIDIEESKKLAKHTEDYLDDYLTHKVTIGGKLAFQSIAKTAINYYILTQKEKSFVKHLFDYLLGQEDLKIANHFYPKKRLYQRESNEIIHLIHLVGKKHSKLLYCYIELFSSFSFLVLLNDNYSGNNITETYCFDVIKNVEIKRLVSLKLTKEKIDNALTTYGLNYQKITAEINRIMKVGNKIQTDKAISEISEKAVDKIFKEKYGHEKFVTEQMIKELSEELSLNLVKFMYRGNLRNLDNI